MNISNLLSSARVPLLGMITENTRAVAIGWNEAESELLLRYYFKVTPSYDEEQMVSDVLGEIVSHNWQSIKTANYECVVMTKPFSQSDGLDGWLFMQKE